MPVYYFDIRRRGEDYRDEIGDRFDSVEQAMAHARSLLSDIARDHPPREDGPVVACALRDEAGRIVYRGELLYRGVRMAP